MEQSTLNEYRKAHVALVALLAKYADSLIEPGNDPIHRQLNDITRELGGVLSRFGTDNAQTNSHDMCVACAEVATQGHTDKIDCMTAQRELCIEIDGLLKRKEYWLGHSDAHERTDFTRLCKGCGVRGTTYIVYSKID